MQKLEELLQGEKKILLMKIANLQCVEHESTELKTKYSEIVEETNRLEYLKLE